MPSKSSLWPRPGQAGDHIPVEPYEPVQLGLQDPLLVAVRAKTLGPVLAVYPGPDAVALHSLGTEIRHVGSAGAHRRQRHRLVDPAGRPLDGLEPFRSEA